LKTLNEPVMLAEETSQNLLAYAIVNKAEVHTYLGEFNQAFNDLEKAVNLFTTMDDEIGLVEAYLLLGFEYYPAIDDITHAKEALNHAQHLIKSKQESYQEQQVRILIGLAKVNLVTHAFHEAAAKLNKAEQIAIKENLIWWLPALAYLQGQTYKALSKTIAARSHFNKGLTFIEEGGCPDYLSPILLELGMMEEDEVHQAGLLKQCLLAAEKRSRYIDKVHCFLKAGQLLSNYQESILKELGHKYLLKAHSLQKQLK
jgi:tetratricopeptide (TPR) repeat protein